MSKTQVVDNEQDIAVAAAPDKGELVVPWSSSPLKGAMRDEKGRILPGHSLNEGNFSTGQAVAKWFRDKMEGIDPTDPQGRTYLERGFTRMAEIMFNDNPKGMKEAVWAFNALMARAYGDPVKDKSELDAMRESGSTFQIQVIQMPPLPPSSQPILKAPRQAPKFIEAEVVDENP